MSKITLFFVISFFFFSACDVINPPYEEAVSQCGDAEQVVPIRRILIEDYTGHQCGNCPRAAEKIEELKAIYCDHIIPVAVHVGFFARTNAEGKYSYDFKTNAGNELNDYFGNDNAGLPNGLINRSLSNGNVITPINSWAAKVQEILNTEPEIDIRIQNTYHPDTRQVDVQITGNIIQAFSEDLSLVVYVVEDNIVNWQKDYSANPQDIENYTHRHVLRAAINGTWGDAIGNSFAIGNKVIKNYSYTIDNEWDSDNCSIVAFVYKNANKEIIQAEDAHFEAE